MKTTQKVIWLMLAVALAALPALPAVKTPAPKPLEEQVRHELIMLPYYGVFDNLSFQVNGGKVTLTGEVTRPVLKSDAANVVERIPGVTSVDNQIEVLPLSPFDDQIRWHELWAIYGNSTLFRYNEGAIPPIRIVVDNGHVTLEGVVYNQMDKQIVGIAANHVPGVFGVTNNLQVRSS